MLGLILTACQRSLLRADLAVDNLAAQGRPQGKNLSLETRVQTALAIVETRWFKSALRLQYH